MRDITIKTTAQGNLYLATRLKGGGAGALDDIDGGELKDGDIAWVIDPVQGWFLFILDQDSGSAEASPSIIKPDNSVGSERWILVNWLGCNAQFGTTHVSRRVQAGVTT